MQDSPTPIAEIEHGPSKFDQFLEEHQKKLMAAGILIFLGVIAYVFYTSFTQKQQEAAGAALTAADSKEAYRKVITDFNQPTTSGSAAINEAALRETTADKITAIESFIANYPEHPGLPSQELKLALLFQKEGKLDQAVAALNSLLGRVNADNLAPRANIALGDIAIQRGETEKAAQYYNQALQHNSQATSIYQDMAKQRLTMMTAKAPKVVQTASPSDNATDTQTAPFNLEQLPNEAAPTGN